jgi:hypothetical protein
MLLKFLSPGIPNHGNMRGSWCVGGLEESMECHCHEQCFIFPARNYWNDMELFCFSLFIAGGGGGGTPAVCSSASDTSLPVTIALEKQRNDYINKYMKRDCSGYLLRGKWQHRGRQFGCE